MKHSVLIKIINVLQQVAKKDRQDEKMGVVLSGCGVYDGSEIHEAVITLLALAKQGAEVMCFAPDKNQADVINHLTGEPMAETRNVLIEAARIARGEIRPLARQMLLNWMRSLCRVASVPRKISALLLLKARLARWTRI